MRTLTALAASLLLLVAPFRAMASPTYPQDINTDLGVMCPAQPCTICHATNTGGGVPVTSFGKAMVGAGLVPNDQSALSMALMTLDASKASSSGSGASYIDDLKMCNDPNAGATSVGYGIYCNATPGNGSGAFLVAFALAAGLAIGRRRRRDRD